MPDHQKCLGQLARPKIPMRIVLTQITKSDTAPHCHSSKPLWMILANSSPIENMCSREASLHEMWVVKANPRSVPPPMAALTASCSRNKSEERVQFGLPGQQQKPSKRGNVDYSLGNSKDFRSSISGTQDKNQTHYYTTEPNDTKPNTVR